MSQREYEEYENQRMRQGWERLIKNVVWGTRCSNFDKNEVQELCKASSDFKQMHDREVQLRQQSEEQQKNAKLLEEQDR